MKITDADRDAAEILRAALADICGFWHKPGDDGPLCQALARHRLEAEANLAAKLTPLAWPRSAPERSSDPVSGLRLGSVRRSPKPTSTASLGD